MTELQALMKVVEYFQQGADGVGVSDSHPTVKAAKRAIRKMIRAQGNHGAQGAHSSPTGATPMTSHSDQTGGHGSQTGEG